jgi:hypothetical protein
MLRECFHRRKFVAAVLTVWMNVEEDRYVPFSPIQVLNVRIPDISESESEYSF